MSTSSRKTDLHRLFLFNGNFYEITIYEVFVGSASISLNGDLNVDKEVKEDAVGASEVYGMWGGGVFNESGMREFYFKPVFD